MTFAEAARIMMSGGSPAVIQPITITENGKYEAPEGTDGYNPVYVAVDDRYDEGYRDGYRDASDIYEQIIEQLNGDQPPVTDDEGNVIDNAVVTPNDDLEDYLTHLIFPSNGGSVTCQGLDGDTAFKFEVVVKKTIYSDGNITYSTGVHFTTINLKTGREYWESTDAYAAAYNAPPYRIKITNCTVTTARAEIGFDWVNSATGEIRAHGGVDTTVYTVGGTAFVGSKDIASTVTQNSEPSEIEDYS